MNTVFVGTRTTRERNARGEGIGVYDFDPATARLSLRQLIGGLVNPSYLALNRAGDRLFTVHGDGDAVSVLRPDVAGVWGLMHTLPCDLRNPVHLALDPSERALVVSSHLTGELVVLPVADDGALSPPVQRIALPGEPGPHRKEQPFSKPHFNPFDPSGRFVLVPDKGLDRVFSFYFDSVSRLLDERQSLKTRENAGPRNLAFHPLQPWAYVVNELDSTVTAYHFDATSGALDAFQTVPSLPDDFTGDSRAAGIAVHPGGRWLYASNRGHDSIALFAIDATRGRLAFVEAVPAQGRTPRFFTPTPDGRFLLVLNEDSDSIVGFAIDSATGRLTPTGDATPCGSPVCLVFAP